MALARGAPADPPTRVGPFFSDVGAEHTRGGRDTSLHSAAYNNDADSLAQLLRAADGAGEGAHSGVLIDPDVRDAAGRTAAHVAALEGQRNGGPFH